MLPDLALPFDSDEFVGCTVGDVLADPESFEGATLADPLEGVDYGRCVAKIMRREDGTPWIHSFAHGRTTYELKHNAASVRAAMAKIADDEVVKTLVKLVLIADLSDDELEQLRNEAAERSGVNKRTIAKMLRSAQQERDRKRRWQARQRQIAERNDPRPMIAVPDEDAPWLPEMKTYNDVIGASSAKHPTLRDIDGVTSSTGKIVVPNTHAFTSANPKEDT